MDKNLYIYLVERLGVDGITLTLYSDLYEVKLVSKTAHFYYFDYSDFNTVDIKRILTKDLETNDLDDSYNSDSLNDFRDFLAKILAAIRSYKIYVATQ
jgi:hypothetical protein